MQRLAAILALSCLSLLAGLPAQGSPLPPQEKLIERRDAKLQRAVFQKAPWRFDYESALAEAAQSGKPMLTYFTQSYAPCKDSDALENGALSDPAFVGLAADFVLLCHVATWVDGEKHRHLLRDKGLALIPTICFLDGEGKLIVLDRERSLPSMLAMGRNVLELQRARKAVGSGDDKALKDLFLVEMALDLLDAEAIERRMAKVELSGAERAALDPKIVDVILVDVARKRGSAGLPASAKRVAEIHREGRRPLNRGQEYWEWLLQHAAFAKDAVLAEQAYPEVLKRIPRDTLPDIAKEHRDNWKKLYDEARQ